MQFPAKQTQPAAKFQGLSVSFHVGLHGVAYVRTMYGRSDGSEVITKPKFLALIGLSKSLSYGAPPRVPLSIATRPQGSNQARHRFLSFSTYYMYTSFVQLTLAARPGKNNLSNAHFSAQGYTWSRTYLSN